MSTQVGHSDKKAEQNACNNSRACVSAFPTQVQQGLVWVWADCSPQAYIESSMQGPAISPEYGRFEGKGTCTTTLSTLAPPSDIHVLTLPLELLVPDALLTDGGLSAFARNSQVRAVSGSSLWHLVTYHEMSHGNYWLKVLLI